MSIENPTPGGSFGGDGATVTGSARNPGGQFAGIGRLGTDGRGLSASILWIGPEPPAGTGYLLWINTADGRWYGYWNDGTSEQWVDLSLPFGEGLQGAQGIEGPKGEKGDSGLGLPVGGTTDQILVKASATDFDTVWGDRPADGNTVLNGTVDPTVEGVDGDFYLNTSTYFIFGPKASGVWPAGVSIVGPTGPTGPAGADGADGTNGADGADGQTVLNGVVDPTTEGTDGDFYINTATNFIFGPKAAGVWPAGVSLVGPTGPAGADGVDGAGVPTGGTAGQLLTKIDGTDFNAQWDDAPVALPSGGSAGQILAKIDATDGNAEWIDNNGSGATPPPGAVETVIYDAPLSNIGSAGQIWDLSAYDEVRINVQDQDGDALYGQFSSDGVTFLTAAGDYERAYVGNTNGGIASGSAGNGFYMGADVSSWIIRNMASASFPTSWEGVIGINPTAGQTESGWCTADAVHTHFKIRPQGGGSFLTGTLKMVGIKYNGADQSQTSTALDLNAAGLPDGAIPRDDSALRHRTEQVTGVSVLSETWEFDAITDAILIPSDDLKLGDRDFVITIDDFNVDNVTVGHIEGIIGQWNAANSRRSWLLRINEAQLEFFESQNGTTSSSPLLHSISAATNYKIVLRMVGETMTLEVDDAVVDTWNTGTHTFFDASDPIMIGNYGDESAALDRGLDGSFARIRIEFPNESYEVSDYPKTRYCVPEGSFTVDAGLFDGATVVESANAAANTITLATGLDASKELVVVQGAAGQVSIAAGGTSLVSPDNNLNTRVINSTIAIMPTGVTDEFRLAGDLG